MRIFHLSLKMSLFRTRFFQRNVPIWMDFIENLFYCNIGSNITKQFYLKNISNTAETKPICIKMHNIFIDNFPKNVILIPIRFFSIFKWKKFKLDEKVNPKANPLRSNSPYILLFVFTYPVLVPLKSQFSTNTDWNNFSPPKFNNQCLTQPITQLSITYFVCSHLISTTYSTFSYLYSIIPYYSPKNHNSLLIPTQMTSPHQNSTTSASPNI